jgi:lipopolysaccharide biosynthesis glycosyltransferase
MLVPGLFVAEAAGSLRTGFADYDIILVTTSPADVTDVHRRWLDERGIQLHDDFDLSCVQDIDIPNVRLTKATLLKLLLAENLADRYDKILYLDADVSIHEQIVSIFSLDTKEFPLAAVPAARLRTGWNWSQRKSQIAHFRALGMTEPYHYINSGVLLIDVNKWNRKELGARALHFIRRNPTICTLPDEDALNAILDGHQAELSPLWNMHTADWSHREVREIAEPVIIHYHGPNKPWRRFGHGRRLFEQRSAYRLYEDFVAETPWPTWLEDQWSTRDLWDNLVFEVRLITRRIRGKNVGPGRAERRAFVEAFRQYCTETAFADVGQGIVRREGARLRLNKSKGRSAAAESLDSSTSPPERPTPIGTGVIF